MTNLKNDWNVFVVLNVLIFTDTAISAGSFGGIKIGAFQIEIKK